MIRNFVQLVCLTSAVALTDSVLTAESHVNDSHMILDAFGSTEGLDAFGWVRGTDPCGTAANGGAPDCRVRDGEIGIAEPPCQWRGIGCTNDSVTEIRVTGVIFSGEELRGLKGGHNFDVARLPRTIRRFTISLSFQAPQFSPMINIGAFGRSRSHGLTIILWAFPFRIKGLEILGGFASVNIGLGHSPVAEATLPPIITSSSELFLANCPKISGLFKMSPGTASKVGVWGASEVEVDPLSFENQSSLQVIALAFVNGAAEVLSHVEASSPYADNVQLVDLGIGTAPTWSSLFQAQRTLETLDLRKNMLYGPIYEGLVSPTSLNATEEAGHGRLKYLDVSENGLTGMGPLDLSRFPRLIHLGLSYNRLELGDILSFTWGPILGNPTRRPNTEAPLQVTTDDSSSVI